MLADDTTEQPQNPKCEIHRLLPYSKRVHCSSIGTMRISDTKHIVYLCAIHFRSFVQKEIEEGRMKTAAFGPRAIKELNKQDKTIQSS